MLANLLERVHNPALRIFHTATRLDECAILRDLHRGRGGRTVTAHFERSFCLQFFLLSFPTGFLKSWRSAAPSLFRSSTLNFRMAFASSMPISSSVIGSRLIS